MSVRCLCGSTLATVVTDTGGDTSRAIVYHCGDCGHDIALQLILRDLGAEQHDRCGTQAGYQNHRRHHETPCADCREAVAVIQRAKRAAVAS